MATPTNKPELALRRLSLMARVDGLVVCGVATLSTLIALANLNATTSAICLLAASAGAMEFVGGKRLGIRAAGATRLLVSSQLLLLSLIVGYCAWRYANPNIDYLRFALLEDSKRTLREAGISEDDFLRFLQKLIYACVALVSLCYQGGLAVYYAIKGRRLGVCPSNGDHSLWLIG